MLKKYEVENMIKKILESLDGQLSPPDYVDGKCTVYDSSVTDLGGGNLIFKFKEDCTSDEVDVYTIKIDMLKHISCLHERPCNSDACPKITHPEDYPHGICHINSCDVLSEHVKLSSGNYCPKCGKRLVD